MFKTKALAAALLLTFLTQSCAGQDAQDFDSEFEKIHEEDFREGRSAFSWMFPKASSGRCSDGSGGICTTASLCRKYGGTRSGSCSGGGGTCCDVTITNCKEESVCTVSFNSSRVTLSTTQAGIFDIRFPRIKNSDMVMLEFLGDSRLANPMRESMVPTDPNMIVRNVGRCMMESVSFSGSPTISNNPFVVCGELTGQHVYLAFGNTDAIMMHVNKMAGNSVINVRATWYSRRFRPVPQNCLQYYTGTNSIIKSFGWPEQQINDLKYTICFDERQANTLTVVDCLNENNNGAQSGTFSITGIRTETGAPMDTQFPGSYGSMLDCYRDWIQLFGENKYCNHTLPPEGISSTTKPFSIAVHFDNSENRAFVQSGCPVPPPPVDCFVCDGNDAIDNVLYPGMCTCNEVSPLPPIPVNSPVDLQCRRLASLMRVDRYNKGFCIRAMRS